MPEGGADGAPGGVDARDEDQDHRAKDVLQGQLLAVDLRVEQERRQVVAGVVLVVLDLGHEVLLHRNEGFDALFQGQVDGFGDDVDHLDELLGVLGRKAQHLADDPGGNELGVTERTVDDLFADHVIEQPVTELANLGLEGVDDARRERRQDQLARERVKGWVRGDGRGDADGCGEFLVGRSALVDDYGAAREVLGVLRNLRDPRVGRGEPASAVAIGVRDGTALTQVLPDRVGVVDPRGIGVVPVGGEIEDGGLVGHDDSSMKMACSGQLAWARRARSRVSAVSVPSPSTTPSPKSSKPKRLGAMEKHRP